MGERGERSEMGKEIDRGIRGLDDNGDRRKEGRGSSEQRWLGG